MVVSKGVDGGSVNGSTVEDDTVDSPVTLDVVGRGTTADTIDVTGTTVVIGFAGIEVYVTR